MTGAEITLLAQGILNIVLSLLEVRAKIDRGELDPSGLTVEELIPETPGEILARVRAEEAAKAPPA